MTTTTRFSLCAQCACVESVTSHTRLQTRSRHLVLWRDRWEKSSSCQRHFFFSEVPSGQFKVLFDFRLRGLIKVSHRFEKGNRHQFGWQKHSQGERKTVEGEWCLQKMRKVDALSWRYIKVTLDAYARQHHFFTQSVMALQYKVFTCFFALLIFWSIFCRTNSRSNNVIYRTQLSIWFALQDVRHSMKISKFVHMLAQFEWLRATIAQVPFRVKFSSMSESTQTSQADLCYCEKMFLCWYFSLQAGGKTWHTGTKVYPHPTPLSLCAHEWCWKNLGIFF